MMKDFILSGRLIFSKRPMGLGILLEFNPPFLAFEVFWVLKIDLIFIRFWIENRSEKPNF